jgi:hypothetical protein
MGLKYCEIVKKLILTSNKSGSLVCECRQIMFFTNNYFLTVYLSIKRLFQLHIVVKFGGSTSIMQSVMSLINFLIKL